MASASDYGKAHRRLRAALLARLPVPCARCGKPILPGQPVDLDHDDLDRSTYIGLSHMRCNRKAAAIRGNRLRAQAYREANGLPPLPGDHQPPKVDRRW